MLNKVLGIVLIVAGIIFISSAILDTKNNDYLGRIIFGIILPIGTIMIGIALVKNKPPKNSCKSLQR